ncbi:tetratricopeptide repeat protein [uncultured Brachyspira sp.]|uniref:tetratricopeptide repeat protein n=1 Tax=uncultured Brachyspira sp. TaxID=221953 RepID=UPI002634721D|nr:tetratricopeptide repeat protein [uncultured Brachyspira sp.]
MNLTQQEQNYYELIIDMLDDGVIDDSERNLLDKKKGRYGLSDSRAKEIEDFALQEIQNKNKPKFNTEGEEEYYELLEDMLEDGAIDESGRSLLNKRKSKYGISDERAKEFEDYIKSVKGINNDSSSNNLELELKEINSLMENSEYDKVIQKCKELLKINVDNPELLLNLAYAYYNNDIDDEALRIGLKGHNLFKSDYRFYGFLVDFYRYKGEKDKAIDICQKCIKEFNGSAASIRLLGFYYYDCSEYTEAIKVFKDVIKIDDQYAMDWYYLGNSYSYSDEEGNEKYYKAIEAFKKALDLDKDSLDILSSIAHNYGMADEYNKKIQTLNKMLEIDPNNSGVLCDIANTYYYMENYDKALEYAYRGIDIDDNNTNLYISLSDILWKLERYDEAIDELYKVLKIYRETDYYGIYTLYTLSDRLADQYRYDEALEIYELALEKEDSEYITAYRMERLGELYCFNDRYYDAIEVFNKSMEMNEDDFYDYGFLASSYLNVEDYDNAIYFYEKAIDRYYDNPYLWNDYGVALGRVGRKEDEKEAYRKALELDPDYELARNNLQNCNSGSDIVSGIVKGIGKFFK